MNSKPTGTIILAAMFALVAMCCDAGGQPYPGEASDSRARSMSVAQHQQIAGYTGEGVSAATDSKPAYSSQATLSSDYAWSIRSPSESGSRRINNWAVAVEETLSNLDRRLARQETALDQALGWRQQVVVGLVGFCALSMIYFWVKLSHLAAKYEQLAPAQEILKDANESDVVPNGVAKHAVRPRAQRPILPSATRSSVAQLPRIQFLSGVIDRLVNGINESRRQRGDVETGYALVGKVVGQGSSRVIMVNSLIEEGPDSDRSGGHHKADRSHQQRELELLQLADGDVMYIGDAHLHPGSMDTCSSGDYQTDLGNVRESRSQEMIFIIATVASAHWGSGASAYVQHGGLRLNFFYLGKASGYEYRRFEPEIIDEQALETSASLRRFATTCPVRACLDFENLRRLRAYKMTVSEMAEDSEQLRPCIEMDHMRLGFKVILLFGPDANDCPEVYVEAGGRILGYQPQSLNGGWSDLIWFTPIVLEVEREITGRLGAGRVNHNGATTGERSAPAGVTSAGPQGAYDHGKFSAIEQKTGRGDQEGNVQVPIRGRGPGLQ